MHEPSCVRTWAAILARFLFDFVPCGLSAADVATDVAVAIVFYRTGRMEFFALSLTTLLLVHLAYISMVASAPDYYFGRKVGAGFKVVPRMGRLLVLAVFAPLLPLLIWLLGFVRSVMPRADVRNPFGQQYSWYPPAETLCTAEDLVPLWTTNSAFHFLRHPERGDRRGDDPVERAMASEVNYHVPQHLLLYVQSVFESLPQAIIQCIAIAVQPEEPSALQVASVLLSVGSISAKFYVVSLSFHVSTFFFKSGLVVFDAFATLFLFSVLNEPLSRKRGWSTLEFVWLGQAGLTSFAIVGVGFILYGGLLSRHWASRDVGIYILAFPVLIPVLAVVFLVSQTVKASALVTVASSLSCPKYFNMISPWRQLCAFVSSAKSPSVYQRRLVHVVKYCMTDPEDKVWYAARRKRLREQLPAYESPGGVSLIRVLREVTIPSVVASLREDWGTQHADDCALASCAAVFALVSVPINMVFPVVHASMHWDHLSNLQQCCLFIAGTGFLVSAVLFPAQVGLFRVGACLKPAVEASAGVGYTLTTAKVYELIAWYYYVPPSIPLMAAVDMASVLPEEVLRTVVGPYLPDGAVRTSQTHPDEAEAWKGWVQRLAPLESAEDWDLPEVYHPHEGDYVPTPVNANNPF